ncbi:MAG: HAD superfamily hydrolase (TIGR01509 family) [Acidimicrobiales bacterium]|jgi:HAD superfamily hydrolase (TIGR01509 family)
MVFVLALSACETDVDIAVDVEEDGAGQVAVQVTFDADASTQLLDLRDDGLRLDDLVQAGWEIVPPEQDESGSVRTTAIKRFGTPEQFAEIMEELSGSAGLFSDFVLTREKSFAQVEYGVNGIVAPSGLAAFSDPDLNTALGRTVAELAAGYGTGGSDVDVSLTVRLPGTVDSELSNGQGDLEAGDAALRTWRTTVGSSTPVEVAVISTTREVTALVWRGVAILAGALAVLVLFGHLLRLLRPERRRGKPATKPRPRPRPAPVAGAVVDQLAEDESLDSDEQELDNPTVVALDGMGVLYREGDDINRILMPFVREHGSEVTHDEVVSKARLISLGRITPSEFWTAVGVSGEPNEIDEDYLSRFQLNPGVVKFLRSLRDRGVQVACITNDATGWATKLRARHSLDGLIDPWVVSGAVGVRKPDRPIYEVLRRVTGVDPKSIMVVDDDLANLDAARELGFRTAWFSPEGSSEESGGHAILRSFEVAETTPAD